MNDAELIGPWIRRFLVEHLVGERNLSRNTQASYRDTLVLLLPFASEKLSITVDRLTLEHLTADLLRQFLQYIEQERKCSISTRNQRLAAIHAMARFIGTNRPEQLSWCTEICSVPFKRFAKPVMCYLEKPEMDALLDAPDRSSRQGAKSYALLLFLYNTGSRADEAAKTKIDDLQLGRSPAVKILGKGNKTRHCPLWSLTASVLEPLIVRRSAGESIFLNCRNQPITRFGIHSLVKRYAAAAAMKVPSIARKDISVHSIRHSTAVHLLRAGVDINTIRAWLGHVSLDTTHIYAEVDLQMKTRALAHCEILSEVQPTKDWHPNKEIMAFLKSL